MSTHDSPRGRPVETVLGSAADIEDRGTQIVYLGGIMRSGYDTLSDLVESGLEAEMVGQAVDALAEVSKEVYKELDRAAELYEKVGPYVRDYGATLTAVQTKMCGTVERANTAWRTYQEREGDLRDAQASPVAYPSGTSPSDDGSDREEAERNHEKGVDQAAEDRQAAYDAWKVEGDEFDSQYDSWELAFDAAVSGIRTETANGIQDDWKDDLDGFVAGAMQWLTVAGIVLAVLALIIGGPIVALLGVIVGVLTLAGTLWQYSRGDASGWDVALAVIGVIPFGAIAEGFSAVKAGGNGFSSAFRSWMSVSPSAGNSAVWGDVVSNFGDDFARWGSGLASGTSFFSTMRLSGQGVSGVADVISTLVSGQSNDFWNVAGHLGSMGEQAAYAFGAVGSLGQSSLVIKDAVGLVTDLFD